MAFSLDSKSDTERQLAALAHSLDNESLIWASGYMAGLAAAGGAPDAVGEAPVPAVEPAETLTIWYGTETGNSRGVAERLAASAEQRGFAVEVSDLAEVRPRAIKKVSLLALVTSTHGEGDPPEPAESFFEYLFSESAPELKELEYSVMALGDTSYPDFCQTGKDLDSRLETLGGGRLNPVVECDVDFAAQEQSWAQTLLDQLESRLKPPTQTPPPVLHTVGGRDVDAAAFDRWNPYVAEVLERSPLTVPPASKSVAHVSLSIEDSGITYEPGDSLGFYPTNDADLVEEVLALTGLHGDTTVSSEDRSAPLWSWLERHLELTQVVRPFIEQWADLADDGALRAMLDDRDAFQRWAQTRQVADVIRDHPAAVGPDQLVKSLRKLAPRLYSIASSPLAAEDEIHLTVRLEESMINERRRLGVASGNLVNRIAAGQTLPVYVESNPRFRLPQEGDRPVIMIGPGTGVAPFRAFLQHREMLGHAGRNWLFFGEQHRRTSFLYQLDWQRLQREGVLDRLSVAFSRDQADRVYVQHRIIENGPAIHDWLEEGANVYVCGSGQGMAQDVEAALRQVISQYGKTSDEAAADQLKQMRRDGRYQKDVY